ncbi:putative transcription factor LHW [Helianthus debilis subsp. tardiflorus]
MKLIKSGNVCRVLSWEDAYCNDKGKNDCSEITNRFTNTNDNLKDECYPQDHLGLAIANMSYRVYSIGSLDGLELWTGKHQWISGLQLVNSLCSIEEITEDLKLVNHIREIFFELHDPSPCVAEISTSSGSVRFHKHVRDQDRTMDKWTKVETITDRQENENLISDLVQSTTCNDQSWGEFMPTISNSEMLNNPETKTNNSFKFLAGYELYEALGPTFYK